MAKLFISHSSQDDAFVGNLRAVLADHGQAGWIDSRELRGGDPLWTEIKTAITDASAYAVVVSTDALQSNWVGEELLHALKVQKERGRDKFPVIPLSLNDTKLGVLEKFFDEEPVYLSVSSEAGGVEAAMDAILVAVGKRLPAPVPVTPQPAPQPLEELVLKLTDLKFHEQDGVRRASARARLVYEPATPGQDKVHSAEPWRFVAPIGPIEAEELRWYLEKYAVWPSHYFRDRAQQVEADLVTWGRQLHDAAMPLAHTANVMQAWERIDAPAGRRFSVHVDTALEAGTPEAEVETAKEVATVLLGLPWELLHDGKRYLFQGAKPARVRRRLPGTGGFDVPVVATPIRILLVTARPEDEACGYIDHRASALPLVEAMEALPGLVKIRVLSPPTLPALRTELDRARDAAAPYHVVHFDGHGIYDRAVGLGGLCFERPEDTNRLEGRRHATVFTNELGPLLRDHRIPLVFLEACQTAQAEKASESVASELLKVGVASVVAMSHSVLVETGLATPNPYNHLTLNPALCPYLRGRLDTAAREALTARWVEAMRGYAEALVQHANQNAELAATLTVLELPNLFALLDLVQRAGEPAATIDLATSLYSLLQSLGKPRLLARVGQVRDTAAQALGDAWTHTRFEAQRTHIEQQLADGHLREAFEGAQQVLERARAVGEQAYPGADYDLAMAHILLGRVLKTAGGSEQALPLLDEARRRFEAVAQADPDQVAERMASVCLTEQGSCLLYLGRLDAAAAAYEAAIRLDEQRGDDRGVAVGKIQLGTVRLMQRRYPEALAAYAEARERFTQLDDPDTVAVAWHQTGMAYQEAGQPDAAEEAYRQSLAIEVRLDDVAGQARTLLQLGNLYNDVLDRPEEAVAFFRQAADKYVEMGDTATEGITRSNLANTLRTLPRLDAARQEIRRAIECKAPFGHAAEPWKSWAVLADIETDAGKPAAAAEARDKAMAGHLTYRRDGGENHSPSGRLFQAVTQAIQAGERREAEQRIAAYREAWKDSETPEADALQAIVAGSRDRTLADAQGLDYSMSAEILFLIETLDNTRG